MASADTNIACRVCMALIADPSERAEAKAFAANLARYVSHGDDKAFTLHDLCGPCLLDTVLDTM